tara:strand:+ start:423 stop:1148 length:726 start_codon:yes stop_codon:yes gene_type:complete
MAINVTPIPKLSAFAVPTITFGTAAAGTAPTVIRSDATIAGVGAQTSVNEAIARYNGTAGQLQGYTSNAPTITDAGVFNLPAGQIVFPATQNASTGANVLDDYENGLFTPVLWDNDNNSSKGQVYSAQIGRYQKVGRIVTIQFTMAVSNLGTLVTTQYAKIGGLPYPSLAGTNNYATIYCGYGDSLALSSAGDTVGGYVELNASHINLREWTATGGVGAFLISNYSVNGQVMMGATYEAAA